MQLVQFLIVIALLTLPVLAWALRLWIKATVERSVSAKFEAELEDLRSDLRVKEGKISALQNNVLSGRAGRQAILDKRRIEAIERLWQAALQLGKFKGAAITLSMLKLDAVSKAVATESNVRQFLDATKGAAGIDELRAIRCETERLFVGEEVWSRYLAYQTVLSYCFMRLHALSMGVEDSERLFATEKVIALVKAVLPAQSAFIDDHGITGVSMLVDQLEMHLLEGLRHALDGREADAQDIVRTNAIIRLVHEADRAIEKAEKD